MESGMPHLLLTIFAGHADVTVPGLTTAACRVPIRFDPQSLRLEAFLPATDPVCRALVDERRSVAIHLCNVVLGDPAATVQLRAQELRLYRNNPLLADEGKNPFTLDRQEPTGDYQAYLKGEIRYASLAKQFPDVAQGLYEQNEAEAKARTRTQEAGHHSSQPHLGATGHRAEASGSCAGMEAQGKGCARAPRYTAARRC